MKSRFVHGVLAASVATGVFVGAPQHVSAQQVVASSDTQRTANVSQVFDRKISVKANAQSLKSVVNAMAESAKVRIQYQDEIFEHTNPSVTLIATDIMLGDALRKVFSGTSLRAVALAPDYISIEPVSNSVVRSVAQGTVTGVVRDSKTGRPVVGATITADSVSQSVKTGEDGTFQLTLVASDHVIHARALGFSRQSKRVTVTENGTVALQFSLDPSASVLNEVVVTGTVVATARKEIPNPITVITAEDIEKRGITRVEELLRGEVPGVIAVEQGVDVYKGVSTGMREDMLGTNVTASIYSRGSSGLGRGGTQTPLKTFVDGVELLDPSYLGTLDPRSIERIEIITGPQAATVYGAGAMGGVMQIFTKKGVAGQAPTVTWSGRYGILQNSVSSGRTPSHYHTVGLSGNVMEALSYASTLSYDYTGQWQPGLFSRRLGVTLGATTGLDRWTITGSFSTTITRNGSLSRIQALGGGGRTENALSLEARETGEFMPANLGGRSAQRVSVTNNQTFGLTADFRAAQWWNHQMTIGRSQNQFALVPQLPMWNTPEDTLYRVSESNGGRFNWSYNTTLLWNHATTLSSTLTLGGSGSNSSKLTSFGCTATKESTEFVPCGRLGFDEISVQKSPIDRSWGGFGSWRIGLFEQLYVTLGIRGEQNPNYGEFHKIDWTPTNGIAYTATVGELTVKLLGSYGRATRTPPPDARMSIYYVNSNYQPASLLRQMANPEIRPEYSRGPQGGVELYWGNLGSLSVNRYNQKITDLLQSLIVDSVEYKYIGDDEARWRSVNQWNNIAEVRQHGWETVGSINIGPVAMQGTYSWNDSRILSISSATESSLQYRGMSFAGVPAHTGSLRFTYSAGRTSVTVSNSFIGKSLVTSPVVHGDESYYWEYTYTRLKMYRRLSSTGGGRMGNFTHAKPGYQKTNIVVSHRVRPALALTLNIVNVGNDYSSDASMMSPSLGRQTSFGVSLRYP